MAGETTDNHVQFDFEVGFANGGGLQGQEFRLDINGDDVSDQALADRLVKHLGLLMVDHVRILNKKVILERNQGAAARPLEGVREDRFRFVDLSHLITEGLRKMLM
jgi:arylformamidase